MKTTGQKIKERRKELKITLKELAEKCNSSKSYMWEIENKTVCRPSADKLSRIASALEVSLSSLLNNSIAEDKLLDSEKLFVSELRKMRNLLERHLDRLSKKSNEEMNLEQAKEIFCKY